MYGEDLSLIHDRGFSQLAEEAGQLAVELLAPEGPGTIVEFGCGGGVTAAHVTAAGHSVIGFDVSAEQIELARARVPDARFEVASFLDAELPAGCAAVLAVGEVLNYGFDERSDADAIEQLFGRVAAVLRPGGLLLFDVAGPGRIAGGRVSNHAQGDGWAILYEAREEGGEVVREITTFREREGCWRRGFERHRLRLYDPRRLEAALRQAGFVVETRDGYGPERFAPGLTVLVARKGRGG